LPEQTRDEIVVNAPLERCYEVVSNVEEYPSWVPDVKEVKVLDRDGEGRPSKVSFRAAAFGRSTHYTLVYDYSKAPEVLSWTLQEGDMTSKLDGSYQFSSEPSGATRVSYELSVELRVPIPGFVKRRVEVRIIQAALQQLKARAEASK
jgi:ribosome-associated toxin RatA of RatAB toxin-antitoxin module